MSQYSLSHVPDSVLLNDLSKLVAQDRATSARLLAHIAEVDARKLYVPAAYPSMFEYCVRRLHMSEGTAFKRIRAARAALRFPVIFEAVAAGRLHLSAVVLLTPHLTPESADDLLRAAAHHSKSEIETMLAHRFPSPDLPATIRPLKVSPGTVELDSVLTHSPSLALSSGPQSVDRTRETGEPPVSEDKPSAPRSTLVPPARIAPLAPQRYAIQMTVDQSTHEKLQYARQLLGHQLPSGDIAAVFGRGLDALIRELEKQKFAASDKPRPGRREPSAGERFIPAAVKRAVWRRDGGRCTFVSDTGHRCESRTRLEFDHIQPVARGGRATVGGMRLRCQAHNQYEAECAFGLEFMKERQSAGESGKAASSA